MTTLPENPDYSRDLSSGQIARGVHRRFVGGHWESIGKLQRDFLVSQGMQPSHRLLDVACGALRGGVHFVDYLDVGNYYGIDINQSLLDAGYDVELDEELRKKLPRENLRRTERFECDFGQPFDFAIAQSLFTHVSLNHVRLCMYQVAKHVRPGGRFFITYNEAPSSFDLDGVMRERSNAPRFGERNIYWYYRSDLEWGATFSPWQVRYIGDWGHPRQQKMLELIRTDGPVVSVTRRITQNARRVARRLPEPVRRAARGRAR